MRLPDGNAREQWFDRIEWFEFGDGTRLSWQDVLLDITTGGEGDDSIWGDLYEDTLTGGLGNDYLSGGGYADTYIFNIGDGQDIIDDDNEFILGQGFVSIDTTPDVLRFGAGISSSDISIAYDANTITLGIGSNGDSVTLQNQNDYYHTGVFGAISNSRIERIEFEDGEVWTWQDLNQRAIASATTSGDDVTLVLISMTASKLVLGMTSCVVEIVMIPMSLVLGRDQIGLRKLSAIRTLRMMTQ